MADYTTLYPFLQKWALSPLDYFPSNEGHLIYAKLLPEWAARFARGQQKYRDVQHLGAKGVFPDLNRKTARLRSDLWEGRQPPEGAEPTDEVILDIIGHLFLMLALLRAESGGDPHANEPEGTGEAPIPAAPNAQPWYQGVELPPIEYTSPRLGSPCPDPARHSDGWQLLPDGVRDALRAVAGGGRIRDLDREAVQDLVQEHDKDS